MVIERWRNIKGFTAYRVSSFGRVCSTKMGSRRILCTTDCSGMGHKTVSMWDDYGHKKKHLVHRLVLCAFDRLPKNNEECRHIDGNPENNQIENLSWSTREENIADRIIHNGSPCGRINGKVKLNELKARIIRGICNNKNRSTTNRKLADAFGVSPCTISDIALGKTWRSV